MCYDDQSSNDTGIIESAASAEEISPSSEKPAQNLNPQNLVDTVPKRQMNKINTKITEVLENSSVNSSEIQNQSNIDVMDLNNSSDELQHASTT